LRNLKSARIVNNENLSKPELGDYIDAYFPTINHIRKPLQSKELKAILNKLKVANNVRGKIKFVLGLVYFILLVQFLTVLLT
jgi:hypothetical protein